MTADPLFQAYLEQMQTRLTYGIANDNLADEERILEARAILQELMDSFASSARMLHTLTHRRNAPMLRLRVFTIGGVMKWPGAAFNDPLLHVVSVSTGNTYLLTNAKSTNFVLDLTNHVWKQPKALIRAVDDLRRAMTWCERRVVGLERHMDLCDEQQDQSVAQQRIRSEMVRLSARK